MDTDHRGVSPVIGVVLMVAVVVVLAVTVSVFVPESTDELSEPPPNVAGTTGEFEPGAGSDEQVARITHDAGDTVDIENIEIVVLASGPDVDTQARLVDLPSDPFGNRIETENIDGNKDLIDNSFGSPSSGLLQGDLDGWSAGDTLSFGINTGEADFTELPDPGDDADKLEVIVVHTPSNAILFEQTFTP